MKRLIYYEENRLILYETLVDGVPDYTEKELHKVSMIRDLPEAGMGWMWCRSICSFSAKTRRQNGADQDSQNAAV